MKKVFTFLMAMVIVMASFAQHNQVGNVTIKTAPERISSKFVKKTTNNIQDKNAASSFWFEYGDGLANVMQLPDGLDGAGVIMCKDTNAYFPWSNSDPSPAQFQATGHVYDWTHSCWQTFYYGSTYSNVPALWGTNNYSIDSLEIVYGYLNAEACPADVVDTLKVMYLINLDNEGIHNYRSIDEATLDTLWRGGALWLPIDPTTCMPALSNAPWGGSDNLDANVQIFEQTFLLHQADTSDNWQDVVIATPEGMSNLSCNRLAVFYTFIPGTTGHTTIDSNCRRFMFYANKDPRDEYTNGGELPYNDLNMNYSTCYDWTLDPSHNWYATAMPDIFWLRERYHTLIGLHAVCSDCAIVNVEEMDKNNVTIYPNPATTEITVNNPTNERTLVEMFNLVGQKVYSEQFVNTTKINVSNMKSGVYMLKVNNHTTKVVVR